MKSISERRKIFFNSMISIKSRFDSTQSCLEHDDATSESDVVIAVSATTNNYGPICFICHHMLASTLNNGANMTSICVKPEAE